MDNTLSSLLLHSRGVEDLLPSQKQSFLNDSIQESSTARRLCDCQMDPNLDEVFQRTVPDPK